MKSDITGEPTSVSGKPFRVKPHDVPWQPLHPANCKDLGVEFSGRGEPEKPTKADDGKKDDVYSEPRAESDAPCTREFFKVLRRVRPESGDWLENLDRNGKQGARLIRSEIDRIAAKAQNFRPKTPDKDKDEPLIARLVALFVGELEQASTQIGRLLDG
ncbi:hypothetical protein [Ruegeria sp. Ofav3-42]|uniref:hypothetical protein n=1 Tax=Ruegeria sp. Ofav3-42 TaxID=2917759 RepID=UPI001EF58848|nr:hypothetical protein [Ruegeria sp. Ofav3-42]MCG7521484.1 hypothetical protein [Ruegeria sp. Ofav3-42]